MVRFDVAKLLQKYPGLENWVDASRVRNIEYVEAFGPADLPIGVIEPSYYEHRGSLISREEEDIVVAVWNEGIDRLYIPPAVTQRSEYAYDGTIVREGESLWEYLATSCDLSWASGVHTIIYVYSFHDSTSGRDYEDWQDVTVIHLHFNLAEAAIEAARAAGVEVGGVQ